MRRMLLWGLALGGLAWAQSQCYLKARPFLKVETGVSGGIALRRDTVLLVIPDDQGGASIWLDDHNKYRKGSLRDYDALASEVAGVYELKSYEPFLENMDPYGLRTSLHAHDGKHCFSYSPQRDCSVRGDKLTLPTESERARFREVCERIRKVESQATVPVSREQFQAAEQLLWKS